MLSGGLFRQLSRGQRDEGQEKGDDGGGSDGGGGGSEEKKEGDSDSERLLINGPNSRRRAPSPLMRQKRTREAMNQVVYSKCFEENKRLWDTVNDGNINYMPCRAAPRHAIHTQLRHITPHHATPPHVTPLTTHYPPFTTTSTRTCGVRIKLGCWR